MKLIIEEDLTVKVKEKLTFADIAPGNYFIFNTTLYLKLKHPSREITNAVRLDDGTRCTFATPDETMVEALEEVTIKYKVCK